VSVLESWEGSNSYAFHRAYRRLGHSVVNIDPAKFVPVSWRRRPLRALRRGLERTLVHELGGEIVSALHEYVPTLFFTFKGTYVTREVVLAARRAGAVAVNYYPDVSFMVHGRHLPRALPAYDWIFTTKSFGLVDLRERLGVTQAEFLPHGFDPEVHAPIVVDDVDRARYGCDFSFIGTWSQKKQELIVLGWTDRPPVPP
jgi:spore maturation protein CgeB